MSRAIEWWQIAEEEHAGNPRTCLPNSTSSFLLVKVSLPLLTPLQLHDCHHLLLHFFPYWTASPLTEHIAFHRIVHAQYCIFPGPHLEFNSLHLKIEMFIKTKREKKVEITTEVLLCYFLWQNKQTNKQTKNCITQEQQTCLYMTPFVTYEDLQILFPHCLFTETVFLQRFSLSWEWSGVLIPYSSPTPHFERVSSFAFVTHATS